MTASWPLVRWYVLVPCSSLLDEASGASQIATIFLANPGNLCKPFLIVFGDDQHDSSNNRMKDKLVLLLSSLLLASGLSQAAPLGTAFTYQGRLDQNGHAANGSYQMLFRLYDVSSGGSYLFITPTNVVAVTNGLFTVDLEFGPLAFAGQERWLEISVRTNTVPPPGFITLPRTRIAPAPHALYASTAGTLPTGTIQARQFDTRGEQPTIGQVLGYDGISLKWRDPVPPGVWGASGNDIYYNVGRVGIGTTTPGRLLQLGNQAVTGSEGLLRLASHSTTTAANRYWDIGVPTAAGDPGGKSFSFIIDDPQTGTLPEFMIRWDTGNIGIGVTNPMAALDIAGNWDGFRPALQLRGQKPTIRFLGDAASGSQNWILHLGSEGPGNLQFMRRDGFIDARVLTLGANNNVGVGTPNPTEKLHVDGAFLRVEGLGGEAAYIGGDGEGGEVHIGSLNPSVTQVAFYNQRSGQYMDAKVCTLTILGGCDLAEPFPMKEDTIEKGSVVVIDHEHPGRLKRSTHAYDKRVAGIVSGANGINPGIALKQEGVMDQGENVALTGRVYVNADASFGAIEPGDLLTTSDTPGHAMKVSDSARAQGAILGKAMSALKDGTGLVLVLVTLQ